MAWVSRAILPERSKALQPTWLAAEGFMKEGNADANIVIAPLISERTPERESTPGPGGRLGRRLRVHPLSPNAADCARQGTGGRRAGDDDGQLRPLSGATLERACWRGRGARATALLARRARESTRVEHRLVWSHGSGLGDIATRSVGHLLAHIGSRRGRTGAGHGNGPIRLRDAIVSGTPATRSWWRPALGTSRGTLGDLECAAEGPRSKPEKFQLWNSFAGSSTCIGDRALKCHAPVLSRGSAVQGGLGAVGHRVALSWAKCSTMKCVSSPLVP